MKSFFKSPLNLFFLCMFLGVCASSAYDYVVWHNITILKGIGLLASGGIVFLFSRATDSAKNNRFEHLDN